MCHCLLFPSLMKMYNANPLKRYIDEKKQKKQKMNK